MSSYRGIKPVLTFESDIHPLRRAQFQWYDKDSGSSMALFAGKEMAISHHDDGVSFNLTYLDMEHAEAFTSVAAAKAAAPDFARAVLFHMLEIVGTRHDDRSLQACLLAGGQ